jgi:hypothetical protein
MVQHALDRGDDVVGVCREQSIGKLNAYRGRIEIVPGATDDRQVIARAVAGCDGVLVVLAPVGMHHYASGTARAVLDHARPGARLVFSCGWWPPRDGRDVYYRRTQSAIKPLDSTCPAGRHSSPPPTAAWARRPPAWGADVHPCRPCRSVLK